MELKLFTKLINTTFKMVIIQLGDLLFQAAEDDFLLREAARLDDNDEKIKEKKYVQNGKKNVNMRAATNETSGTKFIH